VGLSARWHDDPSFGPTRLLPVATLGLLRVWEALARTRTRRLRATAVALVCAGLLVQGIGLSLSPVEVERVLDRLRQESGAGGWTSGPRSGTHFIPQLSPLAVYPYLLRHLATGEQELARDAPWSFLLRERPPLVGAIDGLSVDLLLVDLHRAHRAEPR
jgi:hypothetical protein